MFKWTYGQFLIIDCYHIKMWQFFPLTSRNSFNSSSIHGIHLDYHHHSPWCVMVNLCDISHNFQILCCCSVPKPRKKNVVFIVTDTSAYSINFSNTWAYSSYFFFHRICPLLEIWKADWLNVSHQKRNATHRRVVLTSIILTFIRIMCVPKIYYISKNLKSLH